MRVHGPRARHRRRPVPLRPARKRCAAVRIAHSAGNHHSAGRRADAGACTPSTVRAAASRPPGAAPGRTRWRRGQCRADALPARRRGPGGPRHRSSRPARRIRRGRRNPDSQAPPAAPLPRRSSGRGSQRGASRRRRASTRAGAIFAICRSSRSTARPRAISTTPFTSSAVPAAGICRCTSPTWRITSQRNSALDREARLRGTSVYFPDRAVPMLPEELSNGICSLKPQEDRLVMSALLELDRAGRGHRRGVHARRDPLRRAHDLHRRQRRDRRRSPPPPSATPRWPTHFRAMRDLALILNARRTRRGSMDFDLPEPRAHLRRRGPHDRHRAQRAQHRPSPDPRSTSQCTVGRSRSRVVGVGSRAWRRAVDTSHRREAGSERAASR